MLFQGIDPLAITGTVVVIIIVGFLFAIFLASRYRKFRTNQFIIHLRNGKVKSAGMGGHLFLLPLIDEYIVIPTMTVQSVLEAQEKVISMEYQDISVVAMLYWKVINPELAYSAVSWDRRSDNYVETILKVAAEAIIRTTCANMPIERIVRERRDIIDAIVKDLTELTKDWGIIIESIEIKEVNILEPSLKANFEAIKQAEEQRKARIAHAESNREAKLKELEVERLLGIEQEEVSKEVALKEKEKEIKIAEQEREKIKINSDAKRQQRIIESEGEAAEIKKKLVAQAEGEAESVRQQMLAQAEGFREQVEAMGLADERFLAIQLTNILPEVFKHLSPEKMFVFGENQNGFGSLVKSIIPFLQILPNFSDEIKKFTNGNKVKMVEH
jgi:flotillin